MKLLNSDELAKENPVISKLVNFGRVNVFVYGTLKRGEQANSLLHGWFLGRARVHGYSLVNTKQFPYAIPDEAGEVIGELYKIPVERLESLDRYEGYPRLYNRTFIEVECEDGSKENAFMYFTEKTPEIDGYINTFGLTSEWKGQASNR